MPVMASSRRGETSVASEGDDPLRADKANPF
jgi:hypothetical protein